jgi:hypothetical protein
MARYQEHLVTLFCTTLGCFSHPQYDRSSPYAIIQSPHGCSCSIAAYDDMRVIVVIASAFQIEAYHSISTFFRVYASSAVYSRMASLTGRDAFSEVHWESIAGSDGRHARLLRG